MGYHAFQEAGNWIGHLSVEIDVEEGAILAAILQITTNDIAGLLSPCAEPWPKALYRTGR
jgi:hypothetical protein